MTDYVLKAEAGQFQLTGLPAALIVNGPNRAEINDFVGGSKSARDVDGNIRIEITGSPRRGTRNEPSVLKALAQALASVGRRPSMVDKARDDVGEDGRMHFANGGAFVVQAVTVPPDSLYGDEIAKGDPVVRVISDREAAGWIQVAIEKKLKIPVADRKAMILALDARHAGMLSDASVIKAFSFDFPKPASHGFAEIWLVGPVAARCVKLA